MLKTLQNLSKEERKIFILHALYSSIDGIVLGVLALNEYVFLRSIRGSDVQVGFLFQFSVLVLTFSVFFNEWIKRIKNKSKLIFKVGLLTRIPLFFLFFFPKEFSNQISEWYHLFFLFIFFIYYSAHPIIFPIINLQLKSNYSEENFGRLYSFSTSLNKIVMLVITFVYGSVLDKFPFSYTYIFPIISLLAIVSIYLLSKIKIKETINEQPKFGLVLGIKNSIIEIKTILKKNKAFRDFETGFMFYGFAFMGTVSVITIYFEKKLHLNYSSIAFYKNIYNILAILLLPFFGRLLGRIDPRKFAALTYLSLLLYLFFIAITQYFPHHFIINDLYLYPSLLLAMVFNGFFAATMSLLWSIGSSYFCKSMESLHYQSIHLSFTGLRSFFAPFIGILVYNYFGYTPAFAIGIGFLLLAILWMLNSWRKNKQFN